VAYWGTPNVNNEKKIATVVGNASQATGFGYEKGEDTRAQRPRTLVGLFLHGTTAPNLNANGLALFRAAVTSRSPRSPRSTPPTQRRARWFTPPGSPLLRPPPLDSG
jgi:hypothetical protein